MNRFMLVAGAIVGLVLGGCGEPRSERKLSDEEVKAIAQAMAEVIREQYTLSCGLVPSRAGEQRCDFLRKSDVERPVATAVASEPMVPAQASAPSAAVSAPPDAARPEPDALVIPDAVPVPDAAAPASPPVADAAPPPSPKPPVEVLGSVYSETGRGATINVRVNDSALPRVVGDIGWGAYRSDKFLGFVRLNRVTDAGFDGWINGTGDELKAEGLQVRREPEPKYDSSIKTEVLRVIPGANNLPPHAVTLKTNSGKVEAGQTGFAYRDGIRKGAFRVTKAASKSVEFKLFYAQIGVVDKKMEFRLIPMSEKQLELPVLVETPAALATAEAALVFPSAVPQSGEIATKIYRVMPKEGDAGATLTAQLPNRADLVKVGQTWQVRGVLDSGKYDARGQATVTKVAGKSFVLDFVGAPGGLTSDMVAVYTPPPPPPAPVVTFEGTPYWVEEMKGDPDQALLLVLFGKPDAQNKVLPAMVGHIFNGEKQVAAVVVKEWQPENKLVLIGPKSLLGWKQKLNNLKFKIDISDAAQAALKAESDKLVAQTAPSSAAAKPKQAPPKRPAPPKPRPQKVADHMVQGPAALKAVGLKLTRASIQVGPSAPASPDAVAKTRISYTVGGQPGGGRIRFIAAKSGELVFRIEQPLSELAGKPVFVKMTYQPK